MFVTIITDCRDENAVGRQVTRAAALIESHAHLIGVDSDIEASGNLIDALDAAEGREGVVMANVAPRHGAARKWPNGTPFCYFRYKSTLVLASIDGKTLSLAKKLGIFEEAHVMDIPTAAAEMVREGELPPSLERYVAETQFRSFDFLPRAAAYIRLKGGLASEAKPAAEFEDASPCVWFVDNFGNCKTTLLPQDVGFEKGKTVMFSCGEFACHEHLSQVPDGERALIVGSSGIGDKRFLEIVVQGSSAANALGLKVGSILA